LTALDLAQQLKKQFDQLISAPVEFRGEISLNMLDPERVPEVCGGLWLPR
jgi:hypothetical protein